MKRTTAQTSTTETGQRGQAPLATRGHTHGHWGLSPLASLGPARFAVIVLICLVLCPRMAQASTTSTDLANGTYAMDVSLEGGTGRATITSPTTVVVANGGATATIEWSSPNYDYMLVDGKQYLPTNTEGNSTFEIPVLAFDEPFEVIGDTTAMSKPHEVTYQLAFDASSAQPVGNEGLPPLLLALPVLVALGAALLLHIIRMRR